jgi:CheY-like chemotaxis protein
LISNDASNSNVDPTLRSALVSIYRAISDYPTAPAWISSRKRERSERHQATALTGFGMQQDVERAQQAGFNAHLTKPVNLQKLEAAIWKLIQDRQ